MNIKDVCHRSHHGIKQMLSPVFSDRPANHEKQSLNKKKKKRVSWRYSARLFSPRLKE